MTTLTALLARITEARGPDRELDVAIADALGFYIATNAENLSEELRLWHMRQYCPQVTSSIDAALGLVEKVLPGWTFTIGQNQWHKNFVSTLRWLDHTATTTAVEVKETLGQHPTSAPLAILSALLRAKIDQGEALPPHGEPGWTKFLPKFGTRERKRQQRAGRQSQPRGEPK